MVEPLDKALKLKGVAVVDVAVEPKENGADAGAEDAAVDVFPNEKPLNSNTCNK